MFVDPSIGEVLTNAAGSLVATGAMALVRMSAQDGHDSDFVLGFKYQLADNLGDVGEIDVTQRGAILEFVESPEVKALSEAAAISYLLMRGRHDVELERVLDAIKQDFVSLATGRDIAGGEALVIEFIWDSHLNAIRQAFVDDDFAAALSVDEDVQLVGRTIAITLGDDLTVQVPRFLRSLVSLARNSARLVDLAHLARDIKTAVRDDYAEMKLQHAVEESSRSLHSLYVSRDLLDASGRLHASDEVIGLRKKERVVVTGAPGGGKTTLTQHVVHAAAVSDGIQNVPLVLKARDWKQERPLLLDSLLDSVATQTQINSLTVRDLEDLLILGRAFVVFDGLDELLSVGVRSRFVDSVASFARAYPMTSVLVTSRTVGYEQAPLSKRLFAHYELAAFTDEKVSEYADRWFSGHADHQSKLDAFLHEIQSVPDLRYNPLMLSLLCTLYKSRGHIPRNRRQVYMHCADLLFTRWDSMREIDQPFDHVQHGQDLMQELAIWFFKSPNARRGVEEGQLEKVLTSFFEDTAGVFPAEAKSRARNFLDFCAKRAWLLGNAGTNTYGQRMFVFTHATFMEFFAAEGLVRREESLTSLVDSVIAAYTENASSVVPELIMQAAGANKLNAPLAILREIKLREERFGKRGNLAPPIYLDLRLRLAGVSTVNHTMMDGMLAEAFQALAARDENALAIFLGLLALPRDPRARLEAMLFSDDADRRTCTDRRLVFFTAWAGVEMSQGAGVYALDWGPTIEKIWAEDRTSLLETSDVVLRLYLRHRRNEQTLLEPADLAPFLRAFQPRDVDGEPMHVAWQVLQEGVLTEAAMQSVEALDSREDWLPWAFSDAYYFSGWFTNLFGEGVRLREEVNTDPVKNCLLKFAAATWEINGDDDLDVYGTIDSLTGVKLTKLIARRERDGESLQWKVATQSDLRQAKRICGSWIIRWADLDYRFVKMPTEDAP